MSITWNAAIARLNVANRDLFGTAMTWTHGSLSEDVTVVKYAPSAKVVTAHRATFGKNWTPDPDLSLLRSWIGLDADSYIGYYKAE